jgi:hypothetical protein
MTDARNTGMEETRRGLRRMEMPFKEGQSTQRAVTNNIHEQIERDK